MERPTTFTMILEAEQLDRLRAVKRQIGMPVSEMIRRAIDGWLESVQPDNSATAKEIHR